MPGQAGGIAASTQTTTDEAALLEVAYNEAARALAEQLSLIDSIRNRAGWLLSAAAITTSVLGARALDHGPIAFSAWFALAAFFAVALLSMAILWPRPRGSTTDSSQILSACVVGGGPRSVASLHYVLTSRMQETYSANWSDLSQQTVLFGLAGSLMAVEILAWIAAIVTTT